MSEEALASRNSFNSKAASLAVVFGPLLGSIPVLLSSILVSYGDNHQMTNGFSIFFLSIFIAYPISFFTAYRKIVICEEQSRSIPAKAFKEGIKFGFLLSIIPAFLIMPYGGVSMGVGNLILGILYGIGNGLGIAYTYLFFKKRM